MSSQRSLLPDPSPVLRGPGTDLSVLENYLFTLEAAMKVVRSAIDDVKGGGSARSLPADVGRRITMARDYVMAESAIKAVDAVSSIEGRLNLLENSLVSRLERIEKQTLAGVPAPVPAAPFALISDENVGERTRRQRDEVFGKSHPLWGKVSAYAQTRVRASAPMTARQVAEEIRSRHPEFKVDTKSTPNRLTAMGLFRIRPTGKTNPIKFWFGDGIPDGYERST